MELTVYCIFSYYGFFCYSYTLVLGMLILKEECNIRSGMKSALYMECSSCKVRTYFDTSDTVNDGK